MDLDEFLILFWLGAFLLLIVIALLLVAGV